MAVVRVRGLGRARNVRYRLSVRPPVVELLVRYVARGLWAWRREVLAVGAGWGAWEYLAGRVGTVGAAAGLAGLVGVVGLVPVARRAVAGWLAGGWLRRRWARVASAAGLLAAGGDRPPRVARARREATGWALTLRLSDGLSADDVERVAPRLAAGFRARRVTVRGDGADAGRVRVGLVRREVLGGRVPPVPLEDGAAARWGLDGLPVGFREDGGPWLLPLRGSHVLVAGATGAGKGSVLWSVVRTLGPAVRAGLVEIWAVDPKGGMELAFGRPLFARFATDATEAVGVLEEAVAVMRARAGRLRGRARLHTPVVGDPLVVVVVDEVASLTAYVTDRDGRRRVGAALQLLLSQGRAPGVVVVGAVQDPRKDVVAFRDLFPVRVCLRTTEAAQVDMVLGAGAHARGAHAERIPVDLPGIGYVLEDGTDEPVRVRAAWVDDGEIHRVARRFRPLTPGPASAAAAFGVGTDRPGLLGEAWPLPVPGPAGGTAGAGPYTGCERPMPASERERIEAARARRAGVDDAPTVPLAAGWALGGAALGAGSPAAGGGEERPAPPVGGWVPDVSAYREPPPAALPPGGDAGRSTGRRPAGEDAAWETFAASYRRRHGLDDNGDPVSGAGGGGASGGRRATSGPAPSEED